ncbi:MAG: hypothetical protein VB027_02130 [Gordonibacter sp.]|nr:hypothetical protein [Gordonibacter sp.]
MNTPLDAFVKTDGNREAFYRIVSLTQPHDKPERLFLVGPEQSGKTTLVRARQLDKDLLSTKRVLYRPCAELPKAMRANVYDGFFEDLGTHEVLLLDDFDGFFEDEEIGPKLCQLLLAERERHGLDTVITSRKPLAAYDLSLFGGVLDKFEEITMDELDADGLEIYVTELVGAYTEEGSSPVLSSEAISYIARDLGEKPDMMRKAVSFLMTQYEGEPGVELGRNVVAATLA